MDDVVRVYNPRRGRSHLLDTALGLSTFCGIWPPEDWKSEEDEAYRRRLCDRCYRRAMWKAA